MNIIPAIDLINGNCVRLFQGDYKQQTIYSVDAVNLAKSYQAQGARSLHLVDLDGAKQQQLVQRHLIETIIEELTIPIQLGGGIRTANDVEYCFNIGISQVVLGSIAVTNYINCKNILNQFGAERFVIALDVLITDEIPMVCCHAWSNNSGQILWDVADKYRKLGIETILCTDIACDGTLQGPNVSLYEEATKRFPNIKWQASGGVRHMHDLYALATNGVDGAIVGKALYSPEQSGINLKSCGGIIQC